MACKIASELDCSGMCKEGMTFGVSAIAVITSSGSSCGEVNRTRSKPSIVPHARSAWQAPRSRNSGWQVTFSPSRVTSCTPLATRASISACISPGADPSACHATPARYRRCRCYCSQR